MAIEDSGIINFTEEQKLKVGVSVGSGIGGLETIYNGSDDLHVFAPCKFDLAEFKEFIEVQRLVAIGIKLCHEISAVKSDCIEMDKTF